mmetsp:Transcript_48612/g.72153  ORF Transcript_48612/g.72153 Transcript_48612/m.72153 type:complete len:255 (-) Transcript_48612:797-1561(-)
MSYKAQRQPPKRARFNLLPLHFSPVPCSTCAVWSFRIRENVLPPLSFRLFLPLLEQLLPTEKSDFGTFIGFSVLMKYLAIPSRAVVVLSKEKGRKYAPLTDKDTISRKGTASLRSCTKTDLVFLFLFPAGTTPVSVSDVVDRFSVIAGSCSLSILIPFSKMKPTPSPSASKDRVVSSSKYPTVLVVTVTEGGDGAASRWHNESNDDDLLINSVSSVVDTVLSSSLSSGDFFFGGYDSPKVKGLGCIKSCFFKGL